MAVSALRWFKVALVSQVLLLGYLLAMETLDLFPWNDLASRPADGDPGWAIAVGALPLLACMGFFALGFRPLAAAAVIGYAARLVRELWIWWPKYLLGADAEWQALYEAGFSRTLKLLPSSGVHLAPDVQHLVLQLLLAAVVAASAMAVGRMRYL